MKEQVDAKSQKLQKVAYKQYLREMKK